jgi:hypothetical protein
MYCRIFSTLPEISPIVGLICAAAIFIAVLRYRVPAFHGAAASGADSIPGYVTCTERP